MVEFSAQRPGIHAAVAGLLPQGIMAPGTSAGPSHRLPLSLHRCQADTKKASHGSLCRLRGTSGHQKESPLFGRRLVWQQTGFRDLQIVVLGEVQAEVPSHGLIVAQISVNHHAFGSVHHCGHAPGRIAQMTACAGSTGAKLAHDPSQTLGPVAGSKSFAGMGHTHDEQFFAGRGNHQIFAKKIRGHRAGSPPSSPMGHSSSYIRAKVWQSLSTLV